MTTEERIAKLERQVAELRRNPNLPDGITEFEGANASYTVVDPYDGEGHESVLYVGVNVHGKAILWVNDHHRLKDRVLVSPEQLRWLADAVEKRAKE